MACHQPAGSESRSAFHPWAPLCSLSVCFGNQIQRNRAGGCIGRDKQDRWLTRATVSDKKAQEEDRLKSVALASSMTLGVSRYTA